MESLHPKALRLESSAEEKHADTLSIQYNFDDTHFAVGCSDGFVRVFASHTCHVIRNLNCRMTSEAQSVTSVKWRPTHGNTQNVLVATTGDGYISHWHATSGKLLDKFNLENTQILCSDITQTGSRFAVGCNNMSIKVYDELSRSLLTTFNPGRGSRLGHSNRIFAVKWLDENCLISGGWDNNVILWDCRTGISVGGIFGPHICGESIDYYDQVLYTGSYDSKNQLALWDLRNFSMIRSESFVRDEKPCKIYTLQIQKSSNRSGLAIGCTGNAQILYVDRTTLGTIGEVTDSPGIFCLDFCQGVEKFAAVTTEHLVNVYTIDTISVEN